MSENVCPIYVIFTYYNNQRYYLMKDSSLALLNANPFEKFRSYKTKNAARRYAREITRKCGYLHQFSVIQVYFK